VTRQPEKTITAPVWHNSGNRGVLHQFHVTNGQGKSAMTSTWYSSSGYCE